MDPHMVVSMLRLKLTTKHHHTRTLTMDQSKPTRIQATEVLLEMGECDFPQRIIDMDNGDGIF
jgi:urease accessory protein UreH